MAQLLSQCNRSFRPRDTVERIGRERPEELRPPLTARMGGNVDQNMQAPGKKQFFRPATRDNERYERNNADNW